MSNIEYEAQARLKAYMDAKTALGMSFKSPPGVKDLAAKAAEIDLDKDLGLLGEWHEVSANCTWGFTDARLLRSARVDSAEALHLASQTLTIAWGAREVAVKAYYACLFLIVLSAGQFGLIWWLLARDG